MVKNFTSEARSRKLAVNEKSHRKIELKLKLKFEQFFKVGTESFVGSLTFYAKGIINLFIDFRWHFMSF